MFRNVHRERRFSHAGAGRQNDQLGVVQTAAEGIEIGEASFHAPEGVLMLHPRIHADHHLLEHRLDRPGLGRAAVFKDLEDPRFGPRHQFPGLIRGVVGVAQDVRARVDERAKHRLVPNDLGIVDGVRGMRHCLQEFGDGGHTPNAFEVALGPQPFEYDRGVYALSRIVQLQQVAVEHLMRLVGEVVGFDNERDVVADIGLEQNAAKHRTFGIDVGRTLAGIDRMKRCGATVGLIVALASPAPASASGGLPAATVTGGLPADTIRISRISSGRIPV